MSSKKGLSLYRKQNRSPTIKYDVRLLIVREKSEFVNMFWHLFYGRIVWVNCKRRIFSNFHPEALKYFKIKKMNYILKETPRIFMLGAIGAFDVMNFDIKNPPQSFCFVTLSKIFGYKKIAEWAKRHFHQQIYASLRHSNNFSPFLTLVRTIFTFVDC